MNRLAILAASILAVGCATTPAESITPTVLRYQLEGRNIVEHRDTQDSPCGQSRGCYLSVQCTTEYWCEHHIWTQSTAPAEARAEELAHALGMSHTAWEDGFDHRKCAKVVRAGGGYKVGQTICVHTRYGYEVF